MKTNLKAQIAALLIAGALVASSPTPTFAGTCGRPSCADTASQEGSQSFFASWFSWLLGLF